MARGPWLTAVIVLAAASAVGMTLMPLGVLYLLPLAIPAALLVLATRSGRLGSPVMSPVWIVVGTLVLIGAAGSLFAADLVDAGGASVRIVLTEELTLRAVGLFFQLALWVTLGALLVVYLRKPRPQARQGMAFSSTARGWFLAASAVPGIILVAGTRGELLQRSTYLPVIEGTSSTGLAGTLAVGAVAMTGYLAAGERGGRRLLAVAFAVFYLVLFFSIGSRRFALVPLLFVLGLSAWHATRHRGRWLLVAAAATAAMLPIPLFLRGSMSHGLWPYLDRLALFSYGDVDWLSATNNVLVAYPIAAATAYIEPQIPLSWLLIELNPAPGDMAGWYEIADALRLNFFTPYSAIGELGNYGVVPTAILGLLLGMLLAYFEGRIGHYLREGQAVFALALTGLSALFAVTILQYNLRSSVRLLLYAVLLDLVFRFLIRRTVRRQAGELDGPPLPGHPRSRQVA